MAINRLILGAGILLSAGMVFGGGFFKGYTAGFEAATDKGAARIAEMRAVLAEDHAKAMRAAQIRAEKETVNALAIGARYAKEKERHAQTRKRLEKEIANSGIHDGSAYFDPEFVRVWNEAVGACGAPAATAAGKDSRAAGTFATSGAGSAPCAEFRGERVTARDLAAFIVYHGNRSQNMETQLNALITRIEEYNR